ncbi:MAG: glycosyltransferase [Lachnospiraceae bacterium]|nr:glycosyltransferase [Lachnospiraceae bacterium]
MKILVDGLPRTMGGIGTLILNIVEYSRSLPNNKYEFEFLLNGSSQYISYLQKNGFRYYIAPRVKEVHHYRAYLTELFREHQFDFLWFNNTSKVNIILPILAKRKGGAKLITHTHGVTFEEKGIKGIVFQILNNLHEREMISLVDIPFACSEQAADAYYGKDTKIRRKTIIIKNGIVTSKYLFSHKKRELIREQVGLAKDEIVLGVVGRLSAVKNYPFAVEVLSHLPKDYRLLIIGDGEERESLYSLIDEKKLADRCFMLGKKSNVPDYLCAMDWFLMPSFNEGMPFSVIEAQASGLKCLLSDTLSEEMKLTDLVQYASIQDSKKWADVILSDETVPNREYYSEEIRLAGYSIEEAFLSFDHALRASM